MRTDLLHTLANHLLTVEPETFDLGHWKCGTTACAIGHAATIQEFMDKGLSLSSGRKDYTAYPRYQTWVCWAAVTQFFEIELADAQKLFADYSYPEGYRSSLDVATRIFNFIEENQS